jgi:hypothetical protein
VKGSRRHRNGKSLLAQLRLRAHKHHRVTRCAITNDREARLRHKILPAVSLPSSSSAQSTGRCILRYLRSPSRANPAPTPRPAYTWLLKPDCCAQLLISTRDLRDALCLELTSGKSAAEALPLRGSVIASPKDGSSRGFQTGEPTVSMDMRKKETCVSAGCRSPFPSSFPASWLKAPRTHHSKAIFPCAIMSCTTVCAEMA